MDVVNNICQFLSASTNHTFMILWAIGVLFFIIMEFMTFGLTHIWYAFGCIFAGIAAYNDVSIFLQLVIFIVSSTVLVLLTRPIAEKHVNGKTKKTNIDRLIGQTAIVKETINNKKEQGVVRINGMDWTARTEEIDEVILKGKPVEITVIRLKSLDAFAKAADGKATKIIIPSEIQGVAGLVSSVTEIAKDVKPTTKANK